MARPSRLARGAVAISAVACFGVACTGNEDPPPTNGTDPSKTVTPSPDTTIVDGSPTPPGSDTFSYESAGVAARLVVKGTAGTLTVRNETGRELGPPALYVLLAEDGSRLDATVRGAAPVPDGAQPEFEVTFPGQFDVASVGIIGFVLGGLDYGALIPSDQGG